MTELFFSIHQQSHDKQKDNMDNYFSDWRSDLEQVDDVCIITIQF